jgi:PAS domain S-box-containing protein
MRSTLSTVQTERQLKKLYKHIERLESEKLNHTQVRQALHDLEHRYQSLVENIPDVVYSLDEQGTILTINKAVVAYGYTPAELIGQSLADIIYHKDRERVVNAYFEVVAQGKDYARTQKFRIATKAGEIRWFEANCAIRFDHRGQLVVQEGVCRDITENTHHEQTLIKAHEELEEKVRLRTSELLKANKELQKEIEERRAMEKMLLDRERDLQMEKANLQEANTALKVLLKRREADKRALEEQVLYNVKKLVLPYLNKVQKESPDERHKTYLSIAESNLGDVTCGFSRRLSLAFYGLTVSELRVADFIRQGKKNRDIADMLGLSVRTVEAFRQSIRNKLLLQNKKVNLRTFLMSVK